MEESKPVYSLHQTRFSLDALSLIYRQLRANQQDTQLIDAQTFLTLTLLNIQSNMLPNVWSFIPFESIQELANKLGAKPLTDVPGENLSPLFKRSNIAKREEARKFMDWRKAFVVFALMSGKLPTYN